MSSGPVPGAARTPSPEDGVDVVLEVLEGCGPFARIEAEPWGSVTVESPTELRLRARRADLGQLRTLRRVVSASVCTSVAARRPQEILETSVMHGLAARIAEIRALRPRVTFTGLRLAAAGADTPVMRRLAAELAEHAGLPVDLEDGDLLVRVRPAARRPGVSKTWEVLLRLTPRPLSRRAWRVVDYPGAVNATIAASVLDLLEVGPEDAVLDMTCGSGTFLIEQSFVAAPARSVGVDIDPAVIEVARRHQREARRRGRIEWIVGDVRAVPLEGGFTRILANPPWGELHGDHAENEELLRSLLDRAADLAAPEAVLGILTHEIRRMHAVLADPSCPWALVDEHRFFQKGHHPRLFRMSRRPAA